MLVSLSIFSCVQDKRTYEDSIMVMIIYRGKKNFVYCEDNEIHTFTFHG
jgi:hypothetical protein